MLVLKGTYYGIPEPVPSDSAYASDAEQTLQLPQPASHLLVPFVLLLVPLSSSAVRLENLLFVEDALIQHCLH